MVQKLKALMSLRSSIIGDISIKMLRLFIAEMAFKVSNLRSASEESHALTAFLFCRTIASSATPSPKSQGNCGRAFVAEE